MVDKQSGDEISTLASSVMRRQPARARTVDAQQYNDLLTDSKRLAGSVLSQDETPGKQTDG